MPDRAQGHRRRPHYVIAQCVIRFVARVLMGYESSGTENIPREGAFLVAASHKSNLDPLLVGASLPRELRYFAKRELFVNPMLGRLIRAYGAMPVDRAGADRRALTTALEILSSGQGLLIFPEGTRIRRPGVGEAKPGIGMLAIRSGAPVIPAWAGSTWNPRRSLLRRKPVRILFGAPLHFSSPADAGAARQAYEDATAVIMGAIARLGSDEAEFPA
jgi:1-acyl-sn-glycerol-3-phosphate acyltransferase